jgi:hypothetical protein
MFHTGMSGTVHSRFFFSSKNGLGDSQFFRESERGEYFIPGGTGDSDTYPRAVSQIGFQRAEEHQYNTLYPDYTFRPGRANFFTVFPTLAQNYKTLLKPRRRV